MLKNYFITGLRTLLRQRSTTLLNLGGLTLGVSGTIVLFLILQFHTGFDTFQSKYDRLYRVVTSGRDNDGEWGFTSGVPPALPPAFRLDFPQVEEVVFTQYNANALVLIPQKDGDYKKFEEEKGVVYTDPNVFKVFDRQATLGDVSRALDEPNEAVICRSWAQRYFGKEDAVGEIIRFKDNDFTVGAIVNDPPVQSDLPFYLFLSYATIRTDNEAKGWQSIWSDEHCYFLLKEGEDITTVESQLEAFAKKHNKEADWSQQRYVIRPFSSLHFDNEIGNYNYSAISQEYIIALAAVSLFLIVTACINFINLTTAESIRRSKEVGIRKTMGSSRLQLVMQFLGETSLVTGAAILCSLAVAQLMIKPVNTFLDLQLQLDLLHNYPLIGFLVVLFVIVSGLSGLYPALFISGYNPIAALKNSSGHRQASGFRVRQGLVVTQFVISQLLVILTLVLISQMKYFREKDLGFRKDAIVTIPIPEAERPVPGDSNRVSKARTLAHELTQLTGVEGYSLCFSAPSSGYVMGSDFLMEGKSEADSKSTQVKAADGNYLGLFELKLLAGKNIDDLDTPRSILVNRKFAEVAGFTSLDSIVGKRVRIWGRKVEIAGVVENFHTTSLSAQIEPTVMQNQLRSYRQLALRIEPGNFQQVLPEIQKRWEATYPLALFSYEFVDENIRQFYESEERSSTMLSVFAGVSIAIGCLGLFGLVTFMANQKTKEIGIRKVLGASVESILFLFTREFLVLIVIGFVIAAPVAWWLGSSYLEQFAYKIELGPMLFAGSLLVSMVIALITVGFRSFKAATANPASAIRTE
jgi:putative ABC transport system permease protein